MMCPHCGVAINLEYDDTECWEAEGFEARGEGYLLRYGHCPACANLIVLLVRGAARYVPHGQYEPALELTDETSEDVIFPLATRQVDPEVPERFAADFREASVVLTLSPKSSAALSRRVLQDLLSEVFRIKESSLARQIDAFIHLKDTPAYLADAVDAVRNIGNFAAHPLKDSETGQVLGVEPGEAEWLLDVLEALFDHAFIQPRRLAERRDALNEKLERAGKPPMKHGTA